MSKHKKKCEGSLNLGRVVILEDRQGGDFSKLGDCDYNARPRDNDHDCVATTCHKIKAWVMPLIDSFKGDGDVRIPFGSWHNCPSFKRAIEETFVILCERKDNLASRVAQTDFPWLVVLCTIARSIDAKVPKSAQSVVDRIHVIAAKKWTGPGCKDSAIYSRCVEMLKHHTTVSRSKEYEEIMEQVEERVNIRWAEIEQVHKDVRDVKITALAITAQSEQSSKELAIVLDKSRVLEDDLNRKIKCFNADFAGQLYKCDNKLVTLKSEVDKISETVHALEKGFREHSEQLVEINTVLGAHSGDINTLQEKLEATNATVKKLEATVNEAKEHFEKGSKQREALEDRLREREEEIKLLNKKAAVMGVSLNHAHKKVNENARRNDEAKIAGGDSDAAGATASSSVGSTVSHAEETADAAPTSPPPRAMASSSDTVFPSPAAAGAGAAASSGLGEGRELPLAAQPDEFLAEEVSPADTAMIAHDLIERETAAAMAASEAEAPTSPQPRDTASSGTEDAASKIAAARKGQLARRDLAAAVLHSPPPRAMASSSGTPSWLKAAEAQVFPRPAEVMATQAKSSSQAANTAPAPDVSKRPPLGTLGGGNVPAVATGCPCAPEASPAASPDASPEASLAASPEASLAASPPGASPAAAAEPDDEQAAKNEPDAPAAGAMVTTTTAIVLAVSVLVAMAINYPSFLDFLLAVFHFLKDFLLAVFHFLEEM